MHERGVWVFAAILLLLTAVFVSRGGVHAQVSTSPNYQMVESDFTSGASAESCSGSYCSQVSIGDLAIGEGSSNTMKAAFGSITPDEPLLEVIVEPGASNLGVLSTENTATKTTVIRIRNYLSNGYTLQLIGDPPKYGDHTLSTPSTPTASQPGTEQFAVNAAVNTSPTVGAAPVQVPSDLMSFGIVNDDYRTANLFKYLSEDVIAHSTSESGRTDYTISMIVNISNTTPAGHYTSDFSAVVVPIY